MSRLSELKERKKLDNNGFSLVELIIVIAIMAVLIGVLAPQYLKYVEKSRRSADLDSIDSMVNAVTIYSADPDHSIVTDHLKCTSGTVTADSQVRNALNEAGIASTLPKMSSKAFQDWDIEFSEAGMKFTGTNGAALQEAMGY